MEKGFQKRIKSLSNFKFQNRKRKEKANGMNDLATSLIPDWQ